MIITNEAGIARGKYSEQDYLRLTQWMKNQFAQQGIEISAVYHCPHHPDFSGTCSCRKPAPGMILQARDRFNLDLSQSLLVGDTESDIQAGINAGIGTNILVRSGHAINEYNTRASQIIDSLAQLRLKQCDNQSDHGKRF